MDYNDWQELAIINDESIREYLHNETENELYATNPGVKYYPPIRIILRVGK